MFPLLAPMLFQLVFLFGVNVFSIFYVAHADPNPKLHLDQHYCSMVLCGTTNGYGSKYGSKDTPFGFCSSCRVLLFPHSGLGLISGVLGLQTK